MEGENVFGNNIKIEFSTRSSSQKSEKQGKTYLRD
jgi:hypothetical protein